MISWHQGVKVQTSTCNIAITLQKIVILSQKPEAETNRFAIEVAFEKLEDREKIN